MSTLLVLSASVGNGHMSAAKAIAALAESRGIPACSHDTLDFTPKGFRTWYAGGYETLVRRNPGFWGHLYRSSDRPLAAFQFQTALDLLMCGGIEKLIVENSPEWVLCTHSLPQPTLAKLRKRYGFRMAVCVTDLHPHLMWLRGAPDRYFVPNEQTVELLDARQPGARSRTELVGMPIHSAFVPGDPVLEPLILVSSGGIGGGPVLDVVQALAKLSCRIVVVTGRNPGLKSRLEGADLPSNVELLGHIPIEEMAGLMRCASFMVGKPGGLTMFEAFAVGLPMLVYGPLVIPGQEEDNARFLLGCGAGVLASTPSELFGAASVLLDDSEALLRMRGQALANGRPDAASQILRSLLG